MMWIPEFSSRSSRLLNLWRDRTGTVIIYVTMLLTIMIGGAALVIDGGRLLALNTELQAAADAVALAAANELDGQLDSIDRANLAAANLVANDQRFATGASEVGVQRIRYLSTLADDDQALNAGTETTDPLQARYVEVTVDTRQLDTMFAGLIGGDGSAATSAHAIAGFNQAICTFTPLFMCNPYEQPGGEYDSIEDAAADPAFRRRQIKLVQHGGGQASPGNFGFLDALLGPGAANLRTELGMAEPPTCFILNGVDTKTGANTGPVRQAINTRFDIYDGPMSNLSDNADYRPARNVTKGYRSQGNPCNAEPDTSGNAQGLPRDSCFPNGCNDLQQGSGDGKMGTGEWDFESYWNTNHDPDGVFPNGWSNTNRPSRYEVYRHEIDFGLIPDNSANTPPGEDGNPQCYNENAAGMAPSDDPDRRMVQVAVINCDANLGPGANVGVPVETWVKMFLTEPIGPSIDGDDTSDNAMFAEITEVPDLQSTEYADLLYDIVQLYR